MSSTEDGVSSMDTSTDATTAIRTLATAPAVLAAYKAALAQPAPVYNPPMPVPKLTDRQWIEGNLQNPKKCHNNFHMSPDALIDLHDRLVALHGLTGTQETSSLEALGIFIWTCAHGYPTRQANSRFERSLDTVSRKTSHVADVMFSFAQTVLVTRVDAYRRVHPDLLPYAPYFDGCFGALDGTHIPVRVNNKSRLDFVNRKGVPSINVLAIVNMDLRFIFVEAGMAGSCQDMRVLRECMAAPSFPHPPPGRYYLVDSGYAQESGYLGPYRWTRYHLNEFEGVSEDTLSVTEKFNYTHSKVRNVVERAFGVLKSRWHCFEWYNDDGYARLDRYGTMGQPVVKVMKHGPRSMCSRGLHAFVVQFDMWLDKGH